MWLRPVVAIPARMAAPRRPDLAAAEFVGRMRCKTFGAPPREMFYAQRADTFSCGGPTGGRRIWLLRLVRCKKVTAGSSSASCHGSELRSAATVVSSAAAIRDN